MAIEYPHPIQFALVDDDFDDQYMIQKAAEGLTQSIDVITFWSGEEFVRDLEKSCMSGERTTPDIILLDLNMPGWGGIKTLEKLRSNNLLVGIPIIVYTTSNSPNEIHNAYLTGANSVIVKPGTFIKIAEMMEHLCDYWLGVVKMSHKP